MIVVFANNKGGTSKTTLAVIVSEILSASGVNIVAVDMDHAQMHLSLFLRDSGIPTYKTMTELKGSSFDIAIVDTPPALGAETIKVIEQSDVVIVPINNSKTGLLGLLEIETHTDKNKIIVATSRWRMRARFNIDLFEELEAMNWQTIVQIPDNVQIVSNLDNGRSWDYGIPQKQAEPYLALGKAILDTKEAK